MQPSENNRTVEELFDMSRSGLHRLTRSEQLQSLMMRLLWERLVTNLSEVVKVGKQNQRRLDQTNRNRSYLTDWDNLLDDPDRLISIHHHYDPELSGLYSNTPLLGIISQHDRDQMLDLLRDYRSMVNA